jgi:hypothetical protein
VKKGFPDGDKEGVDDNIIEGRKLGRIVGLDGIFVGGEDGVCDGVYTGVIVGEIVGLTLGKKDG